MRAAARGAAAPAMRRAVNMPAWVITMKVPPTSSAATITAAMCCHSATASMPAAMSAWAACQTRFSSRRRARRGTSRQDTAAARPNSGQAQPKIAGLGITCLAMAGRNVAGMM
ncbi:hypothetical protein D3C72_1266980 [compost metagenome]